MTRLKGGRWYRIFNWVFLAPGKLSTSANIPILIFFILQHHDLNMTWALPIDNQIKVYGGSLDSPPPSRSLVKVQGDSVYNVKHWIFMAFLNKRYYWTWIII